MADTAENRAASRKADRLIKARQWLRYHQNEAMLLGTYLRAEADYFPKEIARLNRAIKELQDQLKNTIERMETCTPEKLKEHQDAQKKYAREVAMIENEEKIAALTALAAKINSQLPDGMTVEQAVEMLQAGKDGAK